MSGEGLWPSLVRMDARHALALTALMYSAIQATSAASMSFFKLSGVSVGA